MSHDWEYKRVEMGWWVICADCGKSDAVYATEEEAKIRRLALRNGVGTKGLGSLPPFHTPRRL